MANDKKLFAVTQWILKVAIVLNIILIALLVCILVGALGLWNFGVLPDLIVEAVAKANPGQVTLNLNGHEILLANKTELIPAVDGVARLAIAALVGGTAIFVLAHFVMRAIQRVVVSASLGDPFIAENAADIARAAWLLLGIHAAGLLLSTAIYGLTPANVRDAVGDDMSIDISFIGLFTVLLMFVLARIFKRGTEMRADLEGTV